MHDFDTITTAALSQLVDVPEGTIKAWKSRGKFDEGIHYAGRAWLPAAVDRCRELATAKDAPPASERVATVTVTDYGNTAQTLTVAEFEREFIAALQSTPQIKKVARARVESCILQAVEAVERPMLEQLLADIRTGGKDFEEYLGDWDRITQLSDRAYRALGGAA